MVLMSVHAARRGEADQVQCRAALLQRGDRLGEDRVGRERAVLDRIVDARQVGHGNAAGAEVHVADLGIAHLPLGQTDEGFRGVDQPLRTGGDQPVEVRGAGAQDGVVGALGTMAPPVEDAEQDRTRSLVGHYEAFRGCGWARSTALNLLGQLSSRGSVLGFWSGTSMAQNTNSPRGSPSMLTS